MQKKYVILDDDSKSILKIHSVMERFSNFTFAASASTYEDGLNLILEFEPELVFLEINPKVQSSQLSLLLINEVHRYLTKIPHFIVISEDDSLAYEAVKYNIADYLLKPITEVDLRKTFLRLDKNEKLIETKLGQTSFETQTLPEEKDAESKVSQKNENLNTEFLAPDFTAIKNEIANLKESVVNLLSNATNIYDAKELTDLIVQTISENLAVIKNVNWESIVNDKISLSTPFPATIASSEEPKRKLICIKSYGDYRFLELDDLAYLQADNNSTDITLKNGEQVTAFKTLKYFEENLPSNFYRIHNSYIVNKDYISRIHTGNSLCYIKNTKNQIPFSKSYKDNIDLILTQLAGSDHKETPN